MSSEQNQALPGQVNQQLGAFVPIWVYPSASLVHVNDAFSCVVTLAPATATFPADPPDIPAAGTQVMLQVSSGSAVITSPTLLPVPTNGNTVVFALRAGPLPIGTNYSRVKLTATIINSDGSQGASASNYGPNTALLQNIYKDLVVVP
ncbi:MAG TPA: hypothetical protein VKU00_30920 [Chthonomonadaceae bacterium]|nr:hypothetical protein [Chthonomonadaceae bacterium]